MDPREAKGQRKMGRRSISEPGLGRWILIFAATMGHGKFGRSLRSREKERVNRFACG